MKLQRRIFTEQMIRKFQNFSEIVLPHEIMIQRRHFKKRKDKEPADACFHYNRIFYLRRFTKKEDRGIEEPILIFLPISTHFM